MDELIANFEKSCVLVQNKGEGLSDDIKLQLYGLFKQATVGECNASCPSFWDFRGKAKWNAWNELGKMTKEEAMKKYVTLILTLGFEIPSTTPTSTELSLSQSSTSLPASSDTKMQQTEQYSSSSRSGFGPVFSRFTFEIEEPSESDRGSPESLVRNGEIQNLKDLIEASPEALQQKYTEGMTLLHIAADSDQPTIIEYLLTKTTNINQLDDNSQTPLYVAALCDNETIVKLLLSNGADPHIPDGGGELPLHATSDSTIKQILLQAMEKK
jgi:acyl-CoA-binding protein